MLRQHRSSRKIFSGLISILIMLVIASMGCNLPIFTSEPETPLPTEAADQQPALAATPRIDTERATAPADESPVDTESAPEDVPEISGEIPPAGNPAIPDCNAFDIDTFNAIIDGTFNFNMQDQLNNCQYESDNGFRLMIGGGKPSSSEEVQTQFNSTIGAIPGSSWEVIDDFYLGMSFSSVSVTAQGVSASGHTIVIVAAAQPGSTPDDLKQIFAELARESAQQLNQQW